MTKTANITCEFEYSLRICQLTQQDAELAKRALASLRLSIDREVVVND